MADDDIQKYPFYTYKLQLVVETFGHLTYYTNQPKFNKSPLSWDNE